jgi:Ser/Thr protein kinase RdoA (MazF antagonist)
VKTWNLSSILRLPTSAGDVWCKSVPPFMAHEGAIMQLVAAEDASLVPDVLADDRRTRTVLLEDVEGDDQWDAPEPILVEMVRRLVRLQARWAGRARELRAAGLPDRRASSFPPLVRALLERPDIRASLAEEELSRLDHLVRDLPDRHEQIAGCGLPETLVHGDFHPGNWRSDGESLTLIDWGDSCVSHPLLDMMAFLPRMHPETRGRVRTAWLDAWRAERPDADPACAAELIEPVAALRAALVYQGFLDGIEPSERVYHRADVPDSLRRALS